jgi:predicted glycosyltransferase
MSMSLSAKPAAIAAAKKPCPASSRGPRIALYSHDTMGLGHMRRNMMIAQRFAAMPGATTLLICGAAEGGAFPMPAGVDCLTLPSFHKDEAGRYGSRRLRVSLAELIGLRSRILEAAIGAYDPHVLIVDNVPRGAEGELDAALATLRRRGRTRCVLGLRDVLDNPTAIRRQWRRQAHEQAIRHYYDSIWVYGDPAVYDLASEYALADDIAAKVQYTGLLDYRQRMQDGSLSEAASVATMGQGRIALCMVGGGQDGDRLAAAFADAALPPGVLGVLLMGPYMPAVSQARFKRLMVSNPRFRAVDFVTEPASLLNSADRVVAMGGYNTVYELLSFNKHGLVVPRTKPRSEQLIRAERLRALGLLEMLHPDELTPAAISRWLARDLGSPPQIRDRMDWNGLERLPKLLDKLLAGGSSQFKP